MENFLNLYQFLKVYMGEVNLPNGIKLLEIYGQVSKHYHIYAQ